MQIKFDKSFAKQLDKAPPKIQDRLKQRLVLFIQDPFNITLNNHALKGDYSGYRSININGDWRAIYHPTSPDHSLFVSLGTHSQLYKTS
jgi:addiction module RelE/StbE family toxin